MKDLELTVLRSDVMRQVALDTAYVAAKNVRADELCDTVPVVHADDELLGTFWLQACAIAREAVAEYLTVMPLMSRCAHAESPSPSADLHLHLRLPDNYDLSQAMTARQSLASFLACHVLAKWLAVALPEAENRFSAAADMHLALLRIALHRRRRPLMPPTIY